MSPEGIAILIAASVSAVLAVINAVQQWQIAIMNARASIEARATRTEIVNKVDGVHELVNSQMTALKVELSRKTAEGEEAKVKLAAMIERDASTAQIARVIEIQPTRPVSEPAESKRETP